LLKTKDLAPLDNATEFRYYCSGVGLVREEGLVNESNSCAIAETEEVARRRVFWYESRGRGISPRPLPTTKLLWGSIVVLGIAWPIRVAWLISVFSLACLISTFVTRDMLGTAVPGARVVRGAAGGVSNASTDEQQ